MYRSINNVSKYSRNKKDIEYFKGSYLDSLSFSTKLYFSFFQNFVVILLQDFSNLFHH